MPVPEADDPTPALLRAARSGDQASLERLFKEHQKALLQRIRGMMGDRARTVLESGDVLQDTLHDIFEGIGRFGPGDERSFLRWASTIAQNNLRSELRRRRLALLESASACLDTHTPSREASRRDLDDTVRQVIASMPEDHRRVLELRDLRQLPFEVIAERMGRSANAVQLLHTRAMTGLGRRLRDALREP